MRDGVLFVNPPRVRKLVIPLRFATRADVSAAHTYEASNEVYAVRQALTERQNAVSLSPEGFDRVDAGGAPGGHKAGSAGDSQIG